MHSLPMLFCYLQDKDTYFLPEHIVVYSQHLLQLLYTMYTPQVIMGTSV